MRIVSAEKKAKQFLYERLNRLNDDELYDIFSKIIDDMYNELPSMTPQRKVGEWIEHSGYNGDDFGKEYSCSECNEWVKEKSKICPNCGSYNGGE